jgi:hypothetical protein
MIVDPDFPDHWKTRLLVNSLDNDQAAPMYVLRLWAHCQNRRQSKFELSSEALKALCCFPGQANKLEASLVASGFVRRDERLLIVCGWASYNASLLAAWENGKKGGRKTPSGTPGYPRGSPDGTDKSRVDKSREDSNSGRKRPAFVSPKLSEVAAYCRERKNHVDPQQFINHYEARGWEFKRGQPMKDWRAAVRTWEKNDFPAKSVATDEPDKDHLRDLTNYAPAKK